MKHLKIFSFLMLIGITITVVHSCTKDKDNTPATTTTTPTTPATGACVPDSVFTSTTGPNLVFKFKFDSTQVRLNNLGQPSVVASGNAALSPRFNFMSQHYIELANTFDSLGHGQVLYIGTSTTTGGGTAAIDYCKSTVSREGVVFFSKPLNQITPGSYSWLRVSLAYQNYNITYKANAIPGNHIATGTLASFIGYKTYISGYKINGRDYVPSASTGGAANHLQGYWGFETTVAGTNYFVDGQAPAGATTVPNPIFASSPIPAGSCVVTGQFVNNTSTVSPLVITGAETTDIVITVSLSINKSFEWHEITADGYYQPEIGESVVDMGIRGLIPIVN